VGTAPAEQEMTGKPDTVGLQTQEVVMIVSVVGVSVQLNDRNACKLDVRVMSRSSKTIGPGLASTPSTRTRICSLAFPEDTRVDVEVEVAFVVVTVVIWETLMNKSESADGFLIVVHEIVCHLPSFAGITIASVL